MKITFLSPFPNLSGGERVVAIHASNLAKLGHEVEVVCLRHLQASVVSNIRRWTQGKGWPKPEILGDSHYANYGINFRVLDRPGPIRDRDVSDGDAVIATFWITAAWTANLLPSKGKKFYLIQGDEGHFFEDFPEAERSYQLPLQHIYISDWISNRIRQRHPVTTSCVVPNSVDVSSFDLGSRNQTSPARVGLIWAVEKIKGIDVAMEAIRIARQSFSELEVVSFGTSYPDPLSKSELNAFYHCPSPQVIAEIYSSCSAWLFPSRFEGFGLPILEAMAARTPVIGTPTGAAPELIGQGGGILVPMEDSIAMAKAIVDICRAPETDWQRMSNVAFQTASSYTWDDATNLLAKCILA